MTPHTRNALRILYLGAVLLVVGMAISYAPEKKPQRGLTPTRESRAAISYVLAGTLLSLGGLLAVAGDVDAESEDEAWLCISCLAPYAPGAHFCPSCAAPVSEFAARGKYESIYAQAWILGRASQRPTRPLHVVGLIVLTSGFMLPLLGLLGWGLAGADLEALGLPGAASMGGMLLASLPYAALFVQGLLRYRRRAADLPTTPYGAPPYWTFDTEWALPDPRDA